MVACQHYTITGWSLIVRIPANSVKKCTGRSRQMIVRWKNSQTQSLTLNPFRQQYARIAATHLWKRCLELPVIWVDTFSRLRFKFNIKISRWLYLEDFNAFIYVKTLYPKAYSKQFFSVINDSLLVFIAAMVIFQPLSNWMHKTTTLVNACIYTNTTRQEGWKMEAK